MSLIENTSDESIERMREEATKQYENNGRASHRVIGILCTEVLRLRRLLNDMRTLDRSKGQKE